MHWAVESCRTELSRYDADGHPYRLTADGVKVFGGCWAHCVEHALLRAADADTVTLGSAPGYVDRPARALRLWQSECRARRHEHAWRNREYKDEPR